MTEPIDIGMLRDTAMRAREDRVVAAANARIGKRQVPPFDLAAAILALAPGAVVAASAIVLATVIGPVRSTGAGSRVITAGRAVGVPVAAEKMIRGTETLSMDALVIALEEGR